MDDDTAQRLDLGCNSDEEPAEAAAPAAGRSSDLQQTTASGRSAAPAGVRSVSRLIRETKQAPPLFDRWTLLPMEDEATSSLQRVMNSEAQLRERVGVLTEMYEGARILAETVPSLKAELKALQKERASFRSERAGLRKELAGLRKKCDELAHKGTSKEQRRVIDDAVAAALARQAAELEAHWSAKMERALAAKEAECIEELTRLLSEKRVMQNRVIARAAHRLQSALVASVLSGWIEYVDQKTGTLATMRKVTQRILMMGCARAMSAWTNFVEERKRTARKVIKRNLLTAIARAFGGWRHVVARQLRARWLIRKLKYRMQHRMVQVSFKCWYDWCHVNQGLVISAAVANTERSTHTATKSQTCPVSGSLSGSTRARGTQTKRVANPDVSLSRHCACCPASHVNVLYSGDGALSLAFTAKALADARSAYYAVAATEDERSEPEPEPEPEPELRLWSSGYAGSDGSAGAVASQRRSLKTPISVSAQYKKELDQIRSKLRALSYGLHGQDPKRIFNRFDRDNSGTMDLVEFTHAMRRGGHLSQRLVSDEQLEMLYREVDTDNSGHVSVKELAEFVWGKAATDPKGTSAEGKVLFGALSEAAANATRGRDKSGAKWCLPDARECDRLFQAMAATGKKLARTLSMAEFDAGVQAHAQSLHHRPSLRHAFVAADTDSDGLISQTEFRTALEYAVLFVGMSEIFESMDEDSDGRINRDEFGAACASVQQAAMEEWAEKLDFSEDQLELLFMEMDSDTGGFIRFSELCFWATRYLYANDSAGAVATVTIDDRNPRNDAATVFSEAERPIYQATRSVAIMSSYAPGGVELWKCNIGDRIQLSEVRTGKNGKRGRITGGRDGWVTIQLPSGKVLLTPAPRTEAAQSQVQPEPPTGAKRRCGSKTRLEPAVKDTGGASAEPAAAGVAAISAPIDTPAAAAAVQSRLASPQKPQSQHSPVVSAITNAEQTAELPAQAAVTQSPGPGYSGPTKPSRWTPRSHPQLQSPPRTPSAPARQSRHVTQDEHQRSEAAASEHSAMGSVDMQVLKAGYLDKQLRQQQPQQEGADVNVKQPAPSAVDGVWKQRYVELVVGTSTSTQTDKDTEIQRQTESQQAALSRARLIFRQSPGGRELGTVSLLPPMARSTGSSDCLATATKSAPGTPLVGTRIVRSSHRRHEHSNAVWSAVTVETAAGDGSSRQVSFRALDHGTVSAWCSAMERALQMVAEELLGHDQECVSEEEPAKARPQEKTAAEKDGAGEQTAAAEEKEQALAEKEPRKTAPAKKQQATPKLLRTRGTATAASKRTDSRRSTRGRR